MVKNKAITDKLSRFGFSFQRGGAHTARTMMLAEMKTLLSYINNPEADRESYLKAIEDDNCLGKRSAKTRKLTSRHLVDLYSLDPSLILFRALLYFWKRDAQSQPLLVLLCAYSRDALLRLSVPFILKYSEGAIISREALEEFIDNKDSGRFSKATLKSTAQNINSTWTQSGHLSGRVKKVRTQPLATPGSVSYALLLGYLSGVRGEALFHTEFIKLLDCSFEKSVELAGEASRRGWIVFKRIGNVIEVLFKDLINSQEMEWIHEQS